MLFSLTEYYQDMAVLWSRRFTYFQEWSSYRRKKKTSKKKMKRKEKLFMRNILSTWEGILLTRCSLWMSNCVHFSGILICNGGVGKLFILWNCAFVRTNNCFEENKSDDQKLQALSTKAACGTRSVLRGEPIRIRKCQVLATTITLASLLHSPHLS